MRRCVCNKSTDVLENMASKDVSVKIASTYKPNRNASDDVCLCMRHYELHLNVLQ
jgi:hypothetical protein